MAYASVAPTEGEYHSYNTAPQEQHELLRPKTLSRNDFLSEVRNFRNLLSALDNDIGTISQLHSRALSSDADTGYAAHQLDEFSASIQAKIAQARSEIHRLAEDARKTEDRALFATKKDQVDALSRGLKERLEGYYKAEQGYKNATREQIARQYRIVNPDAGEAEIQHAVDGGEPVFQSALRSDRTNQASAVLGSVRARHAELQKVERAIQELAMLFQDLDQLVVMQDPIVMRVEEQTHMVTEDLEKGNVEMGGAVKSARNYRKYKWWCLLVVILIILVIVLAVGFAINWGQPRV